MSAVNQLHIFGNHNSLSIIGKRPSGVSQCGQEHLRVVTWKHNAASSRVRTKLLESMTRTSAERLEEARDRGACCF